MVNTHNGNTSPQGLMPHDDGTGAFPAVPLARLISLKMYEYDRREAGAVI